MASLLEDTELTAQQHEFARVIRTSGEALLGVINDILDFSKIEAGHLELEREALDVRACVEGALDVVAVRGAEKGLELAYQISRVALRVPLRRALALTPAEPRLGTPFECSRVAAFPFPAEGRLPRQTFSGPARRSLP